MRARQPKLLLLTRSPARQTANTWSFHSLEGLLMDEKLVPWEPNWGQFGSHSRSPLRRTQNGPRSSQASKRCQMHLVTHSWLVATLKYIRFINHSASVTSGAHQCRSCLSFYVISLCSILLLFLFLYLFIHLFSFLVWCQLSKCFFFFPV